MIRKMYLLGLLVLGTLFWIIPHKKEKIPFSLSAIHTPLPLHPEWETHPLDEGQMQEVLEALRQPYHYLGSGGQCYTFVSLDNRYVIKFIKQRAFALPAWARYIPWIAHKKRLKREERRSRVFSAFKLSFEHLARETGLLFVHFNPTHHLQTTLSVTAPDNSVHSLDLDATQFVLQKKAVLASHYIDALMQANQPEAAKRAINDQLTLMTTLQTQGFYNRDPNFCSNFGFIDERAALIDVGRLVRSEEITQRGLLRTTVRFKRYLTKNHPELLEYFEKEVAKILAPG